MRIVAYVAISSVYATNYRDQRRLHRLADDENNYKPARTSSTYGHGAREHRGPQEDPRSHATTAAINSAFSQRVKRRFPSTSPITWNDRNLRQRPSTWTSPRANPTHEQQRDNVYPQTNQREPLPQKMIGRNGGRGSAAGSGATFLFVLFLCLCDFR